MRIGIPAKYEFIGNPRISHSFKLLLVSGKILDTVTKPIMNAKPAPQPIMN
jgi:hypothetical protein